MQLAELVASPEHYFDFGDPPLRQGDMVLAPLVRLQTDAQRIDRWETFDQEQTSVGSPGEDELLDLIAHSGYGPVMIVTHDCHLDREFLSEVRRLRSEDPALSLADAEAQAEDNPQLDRFLQVCPLVPLEHVATQWESIAAGEVIGSFPVPPLADQGLARRTFADFTHRSTIDRHLIVERLASLSLEACTMVRYALARHDVFRTPEIGFDLEAAVGRRIRHVERSSVSPLLVRLELDDGTVLELVNQPAEIRTDGSLRTAVPGQETGEQPAAQPAESE